MSTPIIAIRPPSRTASIDWASVAGPLPATALAQNASPTDRNPAAQQESGNVLGEIVVTAQRREESLSNVGIHPAIDAGIEQDAVLRPEFQLRLARPEVLVELAREGIGAGRLGHREGQDIVLDPRLVEVDIGVLGEAVVLALVDVACAHDDRELFAQLLVDLAIDRVGVGLQPDLGGEVEARRGRPAV